MPIYILHTLAAHVQLHHYFASGDWRCVGRSARHRKKLAQELGLDKLSLEGSDDEEEQAPGPVSAFQVRFVGDVM